MKRKSKMEVQGLQVGFMQSEQKDYICITDIAKYKNPNAPADIIKNWLRSKNTIDLLGLWEKLHNPDFKLVEFDQFRNEAGYNHFVLSPQKWIESTNAIGLHVSQLVCLANLENLNAVFINEGLQQSDRLLKLNQIAIQQMKILLHVNTTKMKGDEVVNEK